jgi:signal transduction histidine kinase/CheY-like chemotaxis protein
MAAAERRGVREARAESEVSAGTNARDAREAQAQSEVTAAAERRGAREAQAESEVSAGTNARDAREAQERSEVTAGADARDARETQERREVLAGAERRGAREAQAESEVSAGSGAREAREDQERSEVTAAAERRAAREVQERSEVSAATDRRTARDAQERSEVGAHADRRVTREARERKDQALVQAQRLESLGQLAGGVAHDFNNLLAVILNYLSFAAEDVAAAAGSDPAPHLAAAGADLEEVRKAAQRAAGLTHQLLLFARRDVIRPQVLDFDSVITSVEEMLRRTLGEHVELLVTRADDLWPVLADPGQLEQVLVNLAVNARDAMPDGGTLTIDTSNITVDADMIAGGSKARLGRNVRLRVSDTGVGMTTETAEHVFEPFFTTRRDGGGTGLGLATVYGILMQADGDIRIYSEPGAGTTFTITLPVTAEAATPLAEPAPYQRAPTGETVLVVEDEAALREVTKRILTRNGYHVITAASGPEALAIATEWPGEIHLLVTDVVMPHMLGREVAEKMRAVKPGIEVLFMSGYARPILASQGRLDPNVALVEKPFSETDLLATAGQVLNGHLRGVTTTGGLQVEEDGLPVALHVDVEPEQAVAARDRDERVPAVRRDDLEHRVGGVRGALVGEVDPGHRPVEHAPGEHRHVDVRRLGPAVAERERAGLERHDLERAVVVGLAPAEAAEGQVAVDDRAAGVVGVREPAVRVRLPGLDQTVGDGGARAVVQPAEDRDRAGRVGRDDVGAFWPRQPHREVGSDGLRRGKQLTHAWGSSKMDWLRPRSTMSNRYARAHSGWVSSMENSATIRSFDFSSGTEL